MKDDYIVAVYTSNDDLRAAVQKSLESIDISFTIENIPELGHPKGRIGDDYYDIVIIDLDSAEIEGVRLIDILHKANLSLPIICISDTTEPERVVKVMRLGASGYISTDNLDRLSKSVERELGGESFTVDFADRSHFKTLIHSIEGIFWEADAKTLEFKYMSPQVKKILGYNPEQFTEDPNFWEQHIHPEDRHFAVDFCHNQVQGGKNHTFRYRMLTDDGSIRWIRDTISVYEKADSNAVIYGLMVDITDQKNVEDERDHAHRSLKERIKEQKCLYRITSLHEEDLSIDKLLQKAVSYLPDGWQYPEIAAACIEFGGESYESENYQSTEWQLSAVEESIQDGPLKVELVYLEEKEEADIGPFLEEEHHLINTIVRTLTLKINRIMGKRELERKQQLLEDTHNLAKMGSWELDLELSLFFWSNQAKKILGLSDDFEPDLKSFFEFFKEGEDRDKLRESVDEAIHSEKSFDVESKIIDTHENEIWTRVVGEPVFSDGKCIRVYGSIQDIDDRKRAEEAVRDSERRFSSLIYGSEDLYAIVDREGNYVYAAPSAKRERILGITDKEAIGRNVFEYVPEDRREELLNTLQSLNPDEHKDVGVVKVRNLKGETRWLETTIINLSEDSAIGGYVINTRDVTERILKENRIRDIIEHSTIIFYKHDTDHQVTYISPQVEDIFGYSQKEAKQKWTEFATDHPANEVGFKHTLKAIETGERQPTYDLELRKKDGDKVWVRVNEAPIVEDGETKAMVGSLTDITKQREYEEELKEMSMVAAKTTDAIIITDTEEQITWVNKSFEDLTQYTLEEALGEKPGELLQGEKSSQASKNRMRDAIDRKESVTETIRNYSKDGTEYWLELTIDPLFNENDECTGFIAIERDVTEKIKRQARLQESLERYQVVSKATSDTIWEYDIETEQIQYNNNILDVFGYSVAEVDNAKQWWEKNIHPEDRERVFEAFEDYIANGDERFHLEYRFRCADGSYKYVLDRAYIVTDDSGAPKQVIGAMQDITERKNYIKRLKQERERLQEAQQIGKIGDWDFSVNTGAIFWSDQMYDIYGRNLALPPPTYEELREYYPTDFEYHDKIVSEAIENAGDYEFDLKIRTDNGIEKYVHAEGYTEVDDQGQVIKLHGIVQDITDRKKRELEIAAREKQIRAVIDNIEGTLYRYVLRPDGSDDMVYISSGIEDLLGITAQQAEDSTEILWELIDSRDLEEFKDSVETSAETLEPWYQDFRIETPSGEKKWLRGTGRPERLDDGTIQWNTLITNITKEVQQQEINETLVQEVHHRVKNNLAIIIGFLDLQLHELPEDSRERLSLERAINRIYSISQVHKLLYEGSNFSEINVAEYLESLKKHVTNTMNLKSAITFEIDADDLQMNVNELTPLGMLLNELVTNSVKYAFEGKKHGSIAIKISKDNNTYQVYYKDDGIGIEKATFEETQTSGLNLVKILLAQLEAEYRLLDQDGFSLLITFKEKTKGAHGNLKV